MQCQRWHVFKQAAWERLQRAADYLVTLSLSEAGPGRFGRQSSVTDIYHTMPYTSRCMIHVLAAGRATGAANWWQHSAGTESHPNVNVHPAALTRPVPGMVWYGMVW